MFKNKIFSKICEPEGKMLVHFYWIVICTDISKISTIISNARFQVLTAEIMKIRAFWDTAPYSLVVVDRRFRGAYCLDDGGNTHL
jgi:hypothetical protein